MSICCVYKITSPTGRIYIGSTNNYKKRILKYKNYRCRKQPKVYNSLRKHGFNNHKFEIVIECVESDLYKYERMYGDLYDVLNEKNLNLALPGYDEVKGIISEETRLKMSAAKKGRKLSEENKAKLIAANKGRKRKLSEEQKAKLSALYKGRKLSEETKAKLIAANKGRKLSEETKAKLSAALKGRKGKKLSEEQKAKISAALKGRKHSEEHIAKFTASRTKYYFLCNQTGIFYTVSELSKILNLCMLTIHNYIHTNKLHKIPYQLV